MNTTTQKTSRELWKEERAVVQQGGKSLYDAIKEAGIPCAAHESDLYIPSTPEARAILAKFPLSRSNARSFQNQAEGGIWIDIPFAYQPYWDKRSNRHTKQEVTK